MHSMVTAEPSTSVLPISDESLSRFTDFLGKVALQTYPEVESALHTSITRERLVQVLRRFNLPVGAKILDVGCGQGPALDVLREMGYAPMGITINDEDLRVCRLKGHAVEKMDQSFLDLPDASFDLVWARHCVEHSIMPLFTLEGFKRVLKSPGYLYLEVPAPGTACKHEENLNHYSVFTATAWRSLLLRSGFVIDVEQVVNLQTGVGPDQYYSFLCLQKPPLTKTLPEERTGGTLFLALSDGQDTGWGVCAKNLRRELVQRVSVVDLIETPPDPASTSVPGPLLTAIGDRNLVPVSSLRGSSTFGYTFVENTPGEKAVENARRFDRIFCGSTWCCEALRHSGIHHVNVLIQGIDTRLFHPFPPRPDDGMFIIFSGGKFEYRKGQDLVLKAVRILQEKYHDIVLINAWRNVWPVTMNLMKLSKHITFEIEGDTWPNQMQHLYHLNGIDHQRIVTVDLIPHDSMPQLLARTDLGIFPNRCEGGTNLVMMEYMACGRPVIATNFSGHQDIISPTNALLLDRMQPNRLYREGKLFADWIEPSIDELVAQVEFAYHHREDARRIGLRGARDMERFTWSQTAETVRSVIDGLHHSKENRSRHGEEA